MTEPRRRLQVRVTLDSDMGALFDWASDIPERARARELVGMLRVGYAISTSKSTIASPPIPDPDHLQVKTSAKRTPGDATALSESSLELRAADAALEIFDPASVIGVPPA